ncbi:MAG: hypothetical protein AB7I29_07705 [Geobacter sp.]|jgi:hypothetical protein
MYVENRTVSIDDLDRICKHYTAFGSFNELVFAKGDYRPSLDCTSPDLLALANAYDKAQQLHGDARRAFRYRK